MTTAIKGCGTRRGYWNGCRCDNCCTDARAYWTERNRAKGMQQSSAKESTHGTQSHYTNHGCRCEPCKAAQARAVREYRARKSA